MLDRVKDVISDRLHGGRPMIVRDGDETYTVGQRDVREIMQACDCSEEEAMDRLAQWVVDKLSEWDKR